ncbi:TetR/AcrR family transcriptional regulator [Actinomadura logoneensis]|uniref:TetR/AcrR family transcriptional regulator n=1 Tax=Actinomadura logoneensis TaxID=2293572 RepID=A0A372JE01_9ACTN|nr:TetR/AcrR family transcriptional regulator [Actinomadura logoneensis]RFU38202.1 TetR/AcrR family transcriptional regulator [Actinomadura logoneensis]
MSRKVEQGDATRRRLVDTAVALFTEHGFAGTSTTAVVAAAGVTRGALYHHFADKEALFEAAYRQVQREVADRCAAAALAADPTPPARIRAGMAAYLDACLEPHVQRVLLREGPLVLGWERSVAFDDPDCARRQLRDGLREAERLGFVPAGRAEPLAHLLFGAANQAGVVIAAASDQATARAEVGAAMDDLVVRLLTA